MEIEVDDRSATHTPARKPLNVELPTVQSIRLTATSAMGKSWRATGFLIHNDDSAYLITNRHVVSGKDAANQARSTSGAVPTTITMHFPLIDLAVGEVRATQDLYFCGEDGEPLWLEHPAFGRHVDVAALRVDRTPIPTAWIGVLELEDDSERYEPRRVTEELFVVGYPFEVSDKTLGMATWSRASIASEPAVDYEGLPAFLIDARTRQGQSGSPVIEHRPSHSLSPMKHGQLFHSVSRLAGIYSGRVNDQSDLGFVWRNEAIRQILDGQQRATRESLLPPT